MNSSTHLYILLFPKKGVIKIGKANDIGVRIRALQPHWGEVDYEASHYWRVPVDAVFKIEKGLQALLSGFAVDAGEGDGKTELFSVDALAIALKYIEVYYEATPGSEPIRQGVPRLLPAPRPPKRRGKRDRLLANSREMDRTVASLAHRFHRVNRLLTVLYRRQHRIAYEYDVIGHTIRFRVRYPERQRQRADSRSLMDYFSFDIKDLFGSHGVHTCSVVDEGDVAQYTIRLSLIERNDRRGALLSYFLQQTEAFLQRLPQRSSAAAAPIPPLDEDRIFREILEHCS